MLSRNKYNTCSSSISNVLQQRLSFFKEHCSIAELFFYAGLVFFLAYNILDMNISSVPDYQTLGLILRIGVTLAIASELLLGKHCVLRYALLAIGVSMYVCTKYVIGYNHDLPAFSDPIHLISLLGLLIALSSEIVSKKYNLRSFIFLLVFLLACVFFRKNTTILYQLLFIYCARNYKIERSLGVTFAAILIFYLGTILLSLCGAIENRYVDIYGRGGYALGFAYRTVPSFLFLNILLLFVFLMKKRTSLCMLAVLAAMSIIAFLVTNTKLVFLLCLLTLFLLFVEKILLRKQAKKNTQCQKSKDIVLHTAIYKISPWIFIVGVLLSVLLYLAFPFDSHIGKILDSALTNRVWLTQNALEQYGITLFGQDIAWTNISHVLNNPNVLYSYVDCAFIKTLLEEGVIPSTGILILVSLSAIWAAKSKDFYLCVCIIIWALFCVINNPIIGIHLCSFGLTCAYAAQKLFIEPKNKTEKL